MIFLNILFAAFNAWVCGDVKTNPDYWKPEHLSYVYWINWVSGLVNITVIIFTLAGIIE